MTTALRFFELLALGVWLGAMLFFAFVVAPAAFAVLPTRQLAGELVGSTLTRLHLLAAVCGAAFLVAVGVEQRLAGGSLRAVALPIGLVALLLLGTVYDHYFLGERLLSLRAEMKAAFGSIDQTPREHLLRLAFNRYHRVSALLMTANMVVVLFVLVLTVRRLR